ERLGFPSVASLHTINAPTESPSSRSALTVIVPANLSDVAFPGVGPRDQGPNEMEIILANPRGFCAGVNMAIECLERALEFFGQPLYVYHEIVHNKFVVDKFRRLGTVFVESLDEVPEGSPLLYSAHGVSPQIREQARRRSLVAIDATCPLVIKVHLEAIRY